MEITIVSIDTKPQLDPYCAQSLGVTDTVLVLDPERRQLWVEQRGRSGSEVDYEYHGLVLTADITSGIHENDLKRELASCPTQNLLRQVCNGHKVIWDGNNHKGRLTEEAERAWESLLSDLDVLAEDLPYWYAWELGDWLIDLDVTQWGLGFPDGTTLDDLNDTQIEALAEAIEQDAEAERVVFIDPESTAAYLRSLREE